MKPEKKQLAAPIESADIKEAVRQDPSNSKAKEQLKDAQKPINEIEPEDKASSLNARAVEIVNEISAAVENDIPVAKDATMRSLDEAEELLLEASRLDRYDKPIKNNLC